MLLLSSVQYNQTFSTTPAGNSRQFYPRPRYSREHCTRSRNYRGFHIFLNPVPAGNPRVFAGLPHTHARAKLYSVVSEFWCSLV